MVVRVFVAGGTGVLGRRLVPQLVARGHQATATTAPIALLRVTAGGTSRRLLVGLLWAGCLILVARGASGLLDDVVRDLGMSNRGITGLSYQDTLGTAHPSANTLVSTAIIDGYFFLGGILYGRAARSYGTVLLGWPKVRHGA